MLKQSESAVVSLPAADKIQQPSLLSLSSSFTSKYYIFIIQTSLAQSDLPWDIN